MFKNKENTSMFGFFINMKEPSIAPITPGIGVLPRRMNFSFEAVNFGPIGHLIISLAMLFNIWTTRRTQSFREDLLKPNFSLTDL